MLQTKKGTDGRTDWLNDWRTDESFTNTTLRGIKIRWNNSITVIFHFKFLNPATKHLQSSAGYKKVLYITRLCAGGLLVTAHLDQFEVVAGEQQLVHVLPVELLVFLAHPGRLQQCRDDLTRFLNPAISDIFSFQNNGIKKCTYWKTMGFLGKQWVFGKTMSFLKQCFLTRLHTWFILIIKHM